MSESRDYLEMSFRSIECFSNDGKLDAKELAEIFAIAEKDGEIDENEIRVLNKIISMLQPHELNEAMIKQIEIIKKKFSEN